MSDKPEEKKEIKFLDKIPEGAPFSGSQVILGMQVPPAVIARFKRRCEAKMRILAENPGMSDKEASEAALEQIRREDSAAGDGNNR